MGNTESPPVTSQPPRSALHLCFHHAVILNYGRRRTGKDERHARSLASFRPRACQSVSVWPRGLRKHSINGELDWEGGGRGGSPEPHVGWENNGRETTGVKLEARRPDARHKSQDGAACSLVLHTRTRQNKSKAYMLRKTERVSRRPRIYFCIGLL